jgi:hypothetical protein
MAAESYYVLTRTSQVSGSWHNDCATHVPRRMALRLALTNDLLRSIAIGLQGSSIPCSVSTMISSVDSDLLIALHVRDHFGAVQKEEVRWPEADSQGLPLCHLL